MNPRPKSFSQKKKENQANVNLDIIQFEGYEIVKDVNLKIINTKVEKARFDIYGNYVYKIENNSHYVIDAEIDLNQSKEIKPKQNIENIIFRERIEPFNQNYNNETSGVVCEVQYLINYKIKANMKFLINFPSYEQQKNFVEKDEELILKNYELCQEHLSNLSILNIKDEMLNKIFSENKIDFFVDFQYPYNIKELEVIAYE